MEERDLELIVGLSRGHRREDPVEHDARKGGTRPLPAEQEEGEDDCAEAVEQEMDDRGAAGVFGRADGGKERRDAGADVGADDDEVHAVARAADDDPARSEHDDDARDRRGGLDERRDDRADDDEKDGILDRFEYGSDRIFDEVVPHRLGHIRKSDKDEPEPRKNGADGLDVVLLAQHHHERADDRQKEEELGNVDRTERGDPCRDRGADVGAHDDGGRLKERHDARVDEADDHDGRCGRALDDRRDGRADAHARNTVIRRLVEQIFEASVRKTGHTLGHDLHPDEEAPHAAEHLQDKIDVFHCFLP